MHHNMCVSVHTQALLSSGSLNENERLAVRYRMSQKALLASPALAPPAAAANEPKASKPLQGQGSCESADTCAAGAAPEERSLEAEIEGFNAWVATKNLQVSEPWAPGNGPRGTSALTLCLAPA
jgi:hypothetical protein